MIELTEQQQALDAGPEPRLIDPTFLYDYPVMLGEQRIGPDLADIGARMPDMNWHLRHLYAPLAEVKNSLMPPYRYLFATRKIEHGLSSDALSLPSSSSCAFSARTETMLIS